MEKSANLVYKIIIFLLVLLWVYTAASKLMDFNDFRSQMAVQALPRWIRINSLWALPLSELLAAALLIFKRSEFIGLMLSLILISAFTVYVGLAVVGYFKEVPCSCGGVIKAMGWKVHFAFNLFFLLLTSTGIYLFNRERRSRTYKAKSSC